MIHMAVLIRNIEHLQSVVEKIKRVKDVYTVTVSCNNDGFGKGTRR